MVAAHLANLARTSKATGVGPLAHKNQPQPESENPQDLPERHQDSAVLHGVEKVAEKTGEGLFGMAAMAGIGGWAFRNTIGRVFSSTKPMIGRISYAPAQTLNSLSFAEVLQNPSSLVANYSAKMAEYAEKHGGDASKWLARAEQYGGAKIAKVEWTGLKGVGHFVSHGPMFARLMTGGLALGGALAAYRVGRHTKDGLDDLKEVASDLMGREVSRNDLINHPEKLSDAVKEIRANLKAHLIPETAGAAGKMVENAAFAAMGPVGGLGGEAVQAAGGLLGSMGGMGHMAGMMGGMMIQQSAHEFEPSLDCLKSYLLVKDLQNEGKQATAEHYIALMASVSSEVRRVGARSEAVQRVAEQYTNEQISAKDLVHEMYDNQAKVFKDRITKAAEEIQAEAEKENAAEADASNDNEVSVPESIKGKVANENEPPKLMVEAAAHQGKMNDGHALHAGATR